MYGSNNLRRPNICPALHLRTNLVSLVEVFLLSSSFAPLSLLLLLDLRRQRMYTFHRFCDGDGDVDGGDGDGDGDGDGSYGDGDVQDMFDTC